MNLILAIPFPVRVFLIFLLGVCAGSLANLGVCRLAWHRRRLSPWWIADPGAPQRRWSDRLPIIGWVGLRRESAIHGPGFWMRPMLVELLAGIGFAALYGWEIGMLGLLPPDSPRPVPAHVQAILHVQYLVHAVLFAMMLVASLIDIDERTIPDAVTVPGTLLGLVLAATYPWSLLPETILFPVGPVPAAFWQHVDLGNWPFLRLTSPNDWPGWLDGFPNRWSLTAALACWGLWCVALMPRTWYLRHGLDRALQLCFARAIREPVTYWIVLMGAVGGAAVTAVWWVGGLRWAGLLSALVGMAASGGLVWLVRIIGTNVLRREAMGFGDVTLMAMIGAYLGWQACLVIFFLAPFAALVIGILRLIVRREHEIPYGPFLCLATLGAIVFWPEVWQRTWAVFALGWMVPLAVLVCMVLLALMLGCWQWIRSAFQ